MSESTSSTVLSPYLKPRRLGDVVAAIQAMALNDEYKTTCEEWAFKISGDREKAGYWKIVFEEHPEFFRRSSGDPREYSLVWRRAQPRRFDLSQRRFLAEEDYRSLTAAQRRQLNRATVPDNHIKTLIDVAINMHTREIEISRDWRWWVAPVASVIGSFIGAVLAFAAKAMFGG